MNETVDGPQGDSLIQRARHGDGDALAELLSERSATLLGRIGRHLPDKWRGVLDADDVLQETFTDAFLGIETFDPVGEDAFDAWLWTLARNNVVDGVRLLEAHRRGGGFRRLDLKQNAGSSFASLSAVLLVGTLTSPSASAMRAEDELVLREAIAALPEVHRQVVESYDLQGDPISVVAAQVGRSEGAVYLLRNRAHKRLREILLRGD